MARKALLVLAIIVLAACHEVKEENKETLAAEKETRSASAGRERGSLHKLSSMMNRTEAGKQPRRSENAFSKIHKMNRKHDDINMMNDNEGAFTTKMKTVSDNDTLFIKMKSLRPSGPTYEAFNNLNYMSQGRGVFCNFENETSVNMCSWQWNNTVSKNGLGFGVVTAADIVEMNKTSKTLKYTGPSTDADGNVGGRFLYLPMDPTMDNMVIKSPPFHGLWEFCKFEAKMHQSMMQNASIKLVAESTINEVQWILQEVTGNNYQIWHPMRLMIGKMTQEVQIIIEITSPKNPVPTHVLPHIAIDNIRMIECGPQPPVCVPGQLKCTIMKQSDACIESNQICDVVRNCDDGSDETQICEKMPYGSYCDFEQDNCGFEDIPQPILKWSRHNGPTPTDKTGPNYDHTCGPPTLRPTNMLSLLLPAHMNQTLSHCVGYYLFVNMNATGPNMEKADFASTAVMKTVIFNPPPKVHGNTTSKYYNCCTIRFYYQQNGPNFGSLSVDMVELTRRGNITTSLWFSTKDKGNIWYKAVIFLPNVTSRYYLLFKTRMGMRIYSDSAIDDFSMAPECFGLNVDTAELGDYNYYEPGLEEKTTPHTAFVDKPLYRFTTCGATGRFGPNQTMCDAAYNNTAVSVTVLDDENTRGIQVWEAPAEGLYTIIAVGASGGLGSGWAGVSHGAAARALLALHRAERLYMLVGQQGSNACKKTLSANEGQECSLRRETETSIFTSKTHEVRNTHVTDGGGGGGGATYVFLLDKEGQAYPLLAAGGGGGISVGVFRDDGSQHARPHTNATPESGYMYGAPGQTAGAGGGWLPRSGPHTQGFELVRGGAVLEGGRGGAACSGAAHGGFGGGGGGCLRGGGGGGWLGGSTNEGSGQHGGGGWSYVDSARVVREYSEVGLAARAGHGEVVVIPAIHDCGCDYRCVALNEYRSEVKCYCPSTWATDAHDPTKCILEDPWPRISWMLIIALSVAVFVCALAVLCVCLYLYNTYQRRKQEELRRKSPSDSHPLRRLRGNLPIDASIAINTYYGSEAFLPQGVDLRDLPQVSRDSLKLVKALGLGAFGEVYQGLYRQRPNDPTEMPVAVKTLPELSTEQAEKDFMMEAAIMSKFDHSNVVQMIGVCFDRHPRFIVLELLAGGDLKNFLRESRPKPERASALTMKDLLLCALDVAKGCRYLESKRFIHRDIAARNCLLTSRGPGRVVKIADFGMARDIYRADYYKKGGKAMLPIKWMPPEAYIDGIFTIKTDVWSFGVLLWEVFSLGVMPYTGCANREVMEMVSGGGRLDKPTGCPAEIYRVMCECWAPAPADRPAFARLHDTLLAFSQDQSIISTPLPIVRSHLPLPIGVSFPNGPQREPAGDYLVPMSPQDCAQDHSATDPLGVHSTSQTAVMDPDELEDSQYQHLLKVSQEYGNIQVACPRDDKADVSAGPETQNSTKFLPSNSTDRLLSSVSGTSPSSPSSPSSSASPRVWETSFTVPQPQLSDENGTAVDKLISITPTSPKPPLNALTRAIEANVIDKTNHKNTLVPERKTAPIASPDPPRINAWKEPPIYNAKPKPLCLDAAQLEQNLNALKKNSGSVNLNTMNILPPYINVVTPNKLSESKTIQIDPKKAVIDDITKENGKDVEKTKLKQSNSAASLLNGPMTDVPYADSSDTTSSTSGSNQNIINNQKHKYGEVIISKDRNKVTKQGSKGEFVESEISC